MNSSNSRPKWWRLFLTFPLLVVLFVIEGRLKISNGGHQAVQIGVLLLVYGLILLWLKANSIALSRADRKHYSKRIMIVSVAPLQLNKADPENQPMFIHSDFEVNGMLSNTFEMGDVDAKLPPMPGIPQEVDRK
jgi:uncharacterized membrane protein YhaH (DUF805 family)